MSTTRRQFLTTAGAAAVAASLPVRSVFPAMSKGPRPLPELASDGDLNVYFLEVEESIRRQSLVWGRGKQPVPPQGAIIDIPADVEIPLKWWAWTVRSNSGLAPGARLVLRGPAKGKRPKLFTPGDEGLIGVTADVPFPVGIEFENIEMVSGLSGDCLRTFGFRYLGLRNVSLSGGKNGLFLPSQKMVVSIEDSVLMHGGRGDGYTHTAYVNYIEKLIAKRSTFKAAKAQGHAFKCYAAEIDARDCTFASWETEDDLNGGFHGELPVVDVGAWAQTRFIGNTIVRRGPVRPNCMEYRNRQWAKGVNKYAPPDWGTEVVDYHSVDNRDPANPHLFHHFLVNNRFINGVLPNGSQDPKIKANRGVAVRNNGASPWGSHGEMTSKTPHPSDFAAHNERSVVWAVSNRFEGVPFDKEWDERPYDAPQDRAPIRALDAIPAWAKLDL